MGGGVAGSADSGAQRGESMGLRLSSRRNARRRREDCRGSGRFIRRDAESLRLFTHETRFQHELRTGRGEQR